MHTTTKVILGGGISGLSAAYYLTKLQPNHPVTLVEASNRLGGWLKTNIIHDKLVFEQGPRTIRPGGIGANTLSLIEDLGISDQIIPISSGHPAAKNRLIYANGRLHTLPSSLWDLFMIKSPFSRPLIMYLMRDLYAAKKNVTDESIYDFIQRRFGTELADYMISPLICGICAGDAKEITVEFLMKQLFEYEQKYGSISRGFINRLFEKPEPVKPIEGLILRAKKEKWRMYSFENGIETLPKSLAEHVRKSGVNIFLDTKCNKIEFAHDGAALYFDSDKCLKSRHLISSIPAENLGVLVKDQHPILANLLSGIKNVSVGVVNLCYEGDLIKVPAFGFLVPPKENKPILGVIYDSSSFPRGNQTVLTVMMGGRWFEQYFGDSPNEEMLLQVAQEEIRNILRVKQEPTYFMVNILHKCIPQYVVGHNERVHQITNYIKKNNLPLSLCGSSYEGVGINDTILTAEKTVNKLISTSNVNNS